jgi:hypothetical protein
MRLFVKRVIGIEERNDDVDIQQGAHQLHAFCVSYFFYVSKCDDFAA